MKENAGMTQAKIAQVLSVTIDQVRNAVAAGHPTPQKRSGRPVVYSGAQIDEIEEFIRESSRNRRMTYKQLADGEDLSMSFAVRSGLMCCSLGPFAQMGISWTTIRKALQSRGYHRCRALRKPPTSERVKRLRLEFAREHLDWTHEQWCTILWTDETWMTYGHHRPIYVTRKPNEEYLENCVRQRVQRKAGWMLWGSFAGGKKASECRLSAVRFVRPHTVPTVAFAVILFMPVMELCAVAFAILDR